MSPKRWFSALYRASIERGSDGDVRWRALGGLFVAGGLLAMVSIALPADRGSETWPIVALGAIAAINGTATIVWSRRLPDRDGWLAAMLAFGTVLVTLGVVFNHAPSSAYTLLYVWVAFDGFFFLSRRLAYVALVWAGINYAVALAVVDGQGQAETGRWLMLMGTLAVVGLLADVLRTRSDEAIARLSDLARTDALTGLLNRRGFEERMQHELDRAKRTGSAFSLVVGDLDHFKLLNDRYGHHRGDQALRTFSRLAEDTKRVVDAAARIGGEEFALILPETDEHGAYLLAERLRRQVRETLTTYGTSLSVSFGVASYPRHAESAEQLLRHADQAMYLAKRLGRDRSVLYNAEVGAGLEAAHTPAGGEQLPAVLVLAETLDLRDSGTATHSRTVGRYAEMIAAAMGLPQERVDRVRLAGLLHDIGKIGVPDGILGKPGALTEEEWAEMRKHPELGARILAGANLDDIAGWVLAHHERPDGAGYPAGVAGDEIPLEARILAVADSFEAMTSDRVYKAGMPVEEAVQELRRCAGSQFDLEVVERFAEYLVSGLPSASGGAPRAAPPTRRSPRRLIPYSAGPGGGGEGT